MAALFARCRSPTTRCIHGPKLISPLQGNDIPFGATTGVRPTHRPLITAPLDRPLSTPESRCACLLPIRLHLAGGNGPHSDLHRPPELAVRCDRDQGRFDAHSEERATLERREAKTRSWASSHWPSTSMALGFASVPNEIVTILGPRADGAEVRVGPGPLAATPAVATRRSSRGRADRWKRVPDCAIRLTVGPDRAGNLRIARPLPGVARDAPEAASSA